MNKLLKELSGDLTIYFGAALAFFGIAGAFVGARSLIIVISIAVAGILLMIVGCRARKTDNSRAQPLGLGQKTLLDMRTSDSFAQ